MVWLHSLEALLLAAPATRNRPIITLRIADSTPLKGASHASGGRPTEHSATKTLPGGPGRETFWDHPARFYLSTRAKGLAEPEIGWSAQSPTPAFYSSVTVPWPALAMCVTHMWMPSNAIPAGSLPTARALSVAPFGDSSVTVLLPSLVTHMCVPSNAIPCGSVPTLKVPRVAPVGESSVTVLPEKLMSHMFVPSNAIPCGTLPTWNVPSVAPVGDSFVTVLPNWLPTPTHIFVPSNAIPYVPPPPTENVPSAAPMGDSSVTVPSSWLVTHMFVPSNAIPEGFLPTAKVPSLAPVGESSVTVLPEKLMSHMFVPSNAIPEGLLPTWNVPSVAPVGDSSVTVPSSWLVTHMFVPSNAIPDGFLPTRNVPRGPHEATAGRLQVVRTFLQAPARRDATGARGARQSLTAGGQVLHGPASPQSLSRVQPTTMPELLVEVENELLLVEEENELLLLEEEDELRLDEGDELVLVVPPPTPAPRPPVALVETLAVPPLPGKSTRARPPQATRTKDHPIKTMRMTACLMLKDVRVKRLGNPKTVDPGTMLVPVSKAFTRRRSTSVLTLFKPHLRHDARRTSLVDEPMVSGVYA